MTGVEFLEQVSGAMEAPLRFVRRPDPVPADLRLGWRLGALALVLRHCRGDAASLQQLHVLTWAIRSEQTRETFLRWLSGDKRPDDVIVRYDPALSQTLDLALGLGIVTPSDSGAIKLTPEGTTLGASIEKSPNLLAPEKVLLSCLPRRISQKLINDLVSWR